MAAKKTKKSGKSEKAKTPTQITIANKLVKFIAVLKSNGGLVQTACEAADIPSSTAYAHFHSDKEFAAKWIEALTHSEETVDAEMWRRAGLGADGKKLEQKSDTLLIAVSNKQERRTRMRQKFKEVGEAALRGVRDAAGPHGLTEDQVKGVEDAILARYKHVTSTI